MYQIIANATFTPFVSVELDSKFEINLSSMLTAIQTHQPSCIYLANPNNPTGNLLENESLLEIMRAAPGLVVVDEAYFAFSGVSMIREIANFPNLVVMRTLSKSGLAALRLGYAIAHPDWIDQLEKIRLPYNINSLSQVSATFCLANQSVLEQQALKIIAQRERVTLRLGEFSKFEIFPSDTNFFLLRTEHSDRLHAKLFDAGILVKNLHNSHARLKNCLRITIGTESENSRLLDVLSDDP